MSNFDQDLEKGVYQSPNGTGSTEFNNNNDNIHDTRDSNTAVHPLTTSETQDFSNSKDFGSNIQRITTSQTGDIIYLGNQAFHKHELLNAFGGDFNPGIHAPSQRPMGNPAPLGLVGYAICTFMLSLVFLNTRHVKNAQLMVAPATFLGGMITTICGLWCLLVENTWGATALGAFGGFYLSYAAILLDAFGISKAYADSPDDFNSMMGFFLTAWTIFAFSMWLCTFKATWSFFFIIGFVVLYLFFLTIGYFINSNGVKEAAGVFGLLSAFSAFYAIYEGVATKQNSYFVPPSLSLPGAPKV